MNSLKITTGRQLAKLGIAVLRAPYREAVADSPCKAEAARAESLFRANQFCCIVTNAYFYFRYATLVKGKKGAGF